MFLYLDYCDYEERFILQNGNVNDFSHNFGRVQHTYAIIYTFKINLLLIRTRNIFGVTSTNRKTDEIYQTPHNYILGSKLQFTIPFLLTKKI